MRVLVLSCLSYRPAGGPGRTCTGDLPDGSGNARTPTRRDRPRDRSRSIPTTNAINNLPALDRPASPLLPSPPNPPRDLGQHDGRHHPVIVRRRNPRNSQRNPTNRRSAPLPTGNRLQRRPIPLVRDDNRRWIDKPQIASERSPRRAERCDRDHRRRLRSAERHDPNRIAVTPRRPPTQGERRPIACEPDAASIDNPDAIPTKRPGRPQRTTQLGRIGRIDQHQPRSPASSRSTIPSGAAHDHL